MSQSQTQILIATKGRSETIDKTLLTDAELQQVKSMAEAIRLCIKKHPNESNGTIARFLSKHHVKKVPPQWVYNVRHQELKRK